MVATTLTRRLAVLVAVAVVGAAALLTGSARAAMVDHDPVATLGSGSSFEFRDGDLYWHYANGAISAHLTGDLRIDEAKGSCARMRMEYFNDSVSLTTKYGGTVCAPDSETNEWTVDMNPYGSASIDLVKVSVEKETPSAWSIVESAYFKPTLSTDKVRLTADGVDFGDDWFVGSATTGSGTMDWEEGEGMNLTPHLRGYLHLNNVAGLCARVSLRYYDESDGLFATRYGGPACAPDNSHAVWYVDLAPYTSDRIDSVTVALQTERSDGTWQDIDTYQHQNWGATQTVFIDADF
jgi:hypothetical protein